MLLNSLFLAISSSIDSLGIGITYGIKNIFSNFATTFIGSSILICIGIGGGIIGVGSIIFPLFISSFQIFF